MLRPQGILLVSGVIPDLGKVFAHQMKGCRKGFERCEQSFTPHPVTIIHARSGGSVAAPGTWAAPHARHSGTGTGPSLRRAGRRTVQLRPNRVCDDMLAKHVVRNWRLRSITRRAHTAYWFTPKQFISAGLGGGDQSLPVVRESPRSCL